MSFVRSWAFPGRLFAVVLPALVAGGCAEQSHYSQANWYAGGPRPQQAAAVPIPVELEDDGRPSQLPPRVQARALPDDPTQPWSPNYGGPSTQPQPAPVQPSPSPQHADAQQSDTPPVAHRVAWTNGE